MAITRATKDHERLDRSQPADEPTSTWDGAAELRSVSYGDVRERMYVFYVYVDVVGGGVVMWRGWVVNHKNSRKMRR